MKKEQSDPKRRHMKFRRRGITQKETYYRTRQKFEIKKRQCCSNAVFQRCQY
jgi:hypothetical protein